MQGNNIPPVPDQTPVGQPANPAQNQFPNQQSENKYPPSSPQTNGGMPTVVKVIIGIFIFLVFIGIIATCNKSGKAVSTNDSMAVVTIDTAIVAGIEEPVDQSKQWTETSEKDEMTDVMSYWSTLISDNTEYFDFPYEGGSKLKITVRYMKKYGTDVIISISQGQMLCNEYNGTNYVTVRFDDTPAKKYYTIEPADGSSESLFLNSSRDFINRAKTAKTIKIEVPFYQEGNRVFTFTIDEPLKWDH